MNRIYRWRPEWAIHFKTLNTEWLEKYFRVEPIDHEVLSQPQLIIDNGGSILFATHDGAVVGCCALLQHDAGVFELTKMAVTEQHQNHGIGKQLLLAAIDEFNALQGTLLYLESHDSLHAAIGLYEKYGFEHRPHPFVSKYSRSNVYMEWQPDSAPGDSAHQAA